MFFTPELLSLRAHGGIGVVWIAATLGPRSGTRRLTRRDCASVDISATCRFVTAPPAPLSLRLSASLMVGITRVYGQQCVLCQRDAMGLCTSMALADGDARAAQRDSSELDSEADRAAARNATRAPKAAITLGTGSGATTSVRDSEQDDFFLAGLDTLLARRLSSASAPSHRTSVHTPEAGRAVFELGRASSTSMSSSVHAELPTLPFAGLTSTAADDVLGSDIYVPLNDAEDALLGALSDDSRSHGQSSAPPTPGSAISSIPSAIGANAASAAVSETPAVRRAKRARRHRIVFDDPTMLERDEMLLCNGEGIVPVCDMDTLYDCHVDMQDSVLGDLDASANAQGAIQKLLSSASRPRRRRTSSSPVNVPETPSDEMGDVYAPAPSPMTGHMSIANDSSREDDTSVEGIAAQIALYAPCTLGALCANVQRSPARVFHALLIAVTAGHVNAHQPLPYGAIEITAL